jgi:HK97 family phage major capsid protein
MENTMAETLHDRFQAIRSEIRALDEQGVLAGDDARRMAELITDAKGVKAQIEQRGEVADLDAWAGRSTGVPGVASVQAVRASGATTLERKGDTVSLADEYGEGMVDAKTRSVIGTPEYRDAFRTYLRQGNNAPATAFRTLQEASDTSGGYLVPEDVLARVISREPTPTRVAGRVTQLATGRDVMTIPQMRYSTDDLYTSGIRATWTGEIPASATTAQVTDPVFGNTRINVYTAMLSIPMTNDMIEDANFPLVSYVSGKFGETIDLLKDNMVLNGTGIGQPTGILVNPAGDANQPKVVVSGSASTLTTAGIINTAFALPEQYDDNACWVFNKVSTGKTIANLLDTTNRPIWGMGVDDAGLQSGYMKRPLVGYPVVYSGFMPNVAANAYPAIFGNLSGYYLVNRIGFSIQVLREISAQVNQIVILGRVRFGGVLAEPWKVFAHQCHT